jgi:hypothetical protein
VELGAEAVSGLRQDPGGQTGVSAVGRRQQPASPPPLTTDAYSSV